MTRVRCALALVVLAVSFAGVARGQEAYHAFPFETISHKAWIEVTINDEGPFWFVLDTGAPGISINTTTAREIGLDLSNVRETRGGGAGAGAISTRGEHGGYVLGIAGKPFVIGPGAGGLIGLDGVSAYEGRRMDGIIGGALFQRWVVEIDYSQEMIRLYEPDAYSYEGDGERVEIVDFLGHIPMVHGVVTPMFGEPIEATFGVDTGSRMPLVLATPFAARHPFGVDEAEEETVGGGIGGESMGVVARVESFVMGDGEEAVAMEGLAVCMSTDSGGFMATGRIAGLVGGPILSRGRVVFDYGRREMIVEVDRPRVAYDISGLFLTAIAPAYDRYEVMSVRRGSPAERAGLMRGDVITHVNRSPGRSYSLNEVRAMLREPGREMTFVYERKGERRSVRFENPAEEGFGAMDGAFVRPILR
jgi:PDZ domain/Aspartyl protease